MSKNKYVIPPQILEVLGPPPLLGSENPKRWKETLARYAQSYPPKDADDFEGWRNVWNLACDHWEEERMKRFKVEVLEAPRRAKLEQEFQARVDKVEDKLRTQALDQALAEWRKYPGSGRRAESNEKLSAETKGLRAGADPKLPAEATTIPAVAATEPTPLLPPATDADYADAFAENLHIYCCADQIQNSARKRYDAVRDQIDLRRAAELASKMVNGEVAPPERQLQSREVSSVEYLGESASATTSVLLSSIQPFTPDASVTETLMSVRSMQLLAPPNSPEPQGSSEVSTASAVDAAPAIEQLSIAVGETSRPASSPQHLEAPNLPEPQDLAEASIGSTLDVSAVVALSTTVGETTKSASSLQFLEVPNSSEPQESSEVSTASAMDVTPAIEPSTAVGEGDPARVPPGMDTNNIETNNVATDPSLAAPPAGRASSPGTSVTSTAVTASVGSVIAGAVMPEPTPAAERKDERDRVKFPGALVQPSQQHRVASAQKESEADWIDTIQACMRRDRERARGRSR
jgi:hypothetical protein